MSEERRVPVSVLRKSESLADSLAAECDELRARVKELEAQLLDEQDNYAGAMADLKHFEPLAARMRAERDAALDSLHALAEWADAVKGVTDAAQEEWADEDEDELAYENQCFRQLLEGGWDATGGDDGPNA